MSTGTPDLPIEFEKASEECEDARPHDFNHQVRDRIESTVPNRLRSEADLQGLEVEGSIGKGKIANVPWIRVFDPSVAPNPKRGPYIVFLLADKEDRLLLTLNQGVKDLKETIGIENSREILRDRSQLLANHFSTSTFRKARVEFADKSDTGRNTLFQQGAVCVREYDTTKLPPEDKLIAHLETLIEKYLELVNNDVYSELENAFDQTTIEQGNPFSVDPLPEQPDEYDGIDDAETRITELIEASEYHHHWKADDEIAAGLVSSWDSQLYGLDWDSERTPKEDRQLKRINDTYVDHQSELEDDAYELNIGTLNQLSPSELLYVIRIKRLSPKFNHVRFLICKKESYEVTEPSSEENWEYGDFDLKEPEFGLGPKDIDLDGLYYENEQRLLEEILQALGSENHLMLVGPPGTGKSEIAQIVTQHLMEESHEMTTATADWSTFDTIGGYRQQESGALEFRPGLFLDRFQTNDGKPTNEWLIVDEFNRANIDKAFGSLFSVLTGDDVVLPFTDNQDRDIRVYGDSVDDDTVVGSHEYVVPSSWRLVATLNTFDKSSLYDLSYALSRRFSRIHIPAPDNDTIENRIDQYVDCWDDLDPSDPERQAAVAVWKAVQDRRPLGPAIIRDVLAVRKGTDLTPGVIQHVLPQFEGLVNRRQKTLLESLADLNCIEEARLEDYGQDVFNLSDLDLS